MTEIAQVTSESSAPATTNNGSAAAVSATPPAPRPASEYAELKRRVKEAGLLEKQPLFYTSQILLILSLLAVSITVLVLVDALWLQLLNAVFLAFVFTQISFLGHDASHRQIFGSARNNNLVGTIFWNVLIAMSNRWFIYRHNRHHASSNELANDPDADLIILSFSERQAHERQGLLRFFVRYQVFLLPLLSLEMIVLHYASYRYLRSQRGNYPAIEVPLTILSLMAYLALPYYFLGFGQAVLFIVVHQLFFGLYFSSVIASNHKGMPYWDENAVLDFLSQQVLTSRNVTSSPLTDFWYGGLNFQIEHHLFPNMPRNKLRSAQVIVKRFCEERSISYCETGLVQSYRDVLRSLRAVSVLERADS